MIITGNYDFEASVVVLAGVLGIDLRRWMVLGQLRGCRHWRARGQSELSGVRRLLRGPKDY